MKNEIEKSKKYRKWINPKVVSSKTSYKIDKLLPILTNKKRTKTQITKIRNDIEAITTDFTFFKSKRVMNNCMATNWVIGKKDLLSNQKFLKKQKPSLLPDI